MIKSRAELASCKTGRGPNGKSAHRSGKHELHAIDASRSFSITWGSARLIPVRRAWCTIARLRDCEDQERQDERYGSQDTDPSDRIVQYPRRRGEAARRSGEYDHWRRSSFSRECTSFLHSCILRG